MDSKTVVAICRTKTFNDPCDLCGRAIEIGEEYSFTATADGGVLETTTLCKTCAHIADAANETYEGLGDVQRGCQDFLIETVCSNCQTSGDCRIENRATCAAIKRQFTFG